MAHVDVSQLSKQEHDELTCAYSALLLHDDGLEISVSTQIQLLYHFSQGEKLAKVIKASGNEVEAFWPAMFAKALRGQNIEELLSSISSGPVVAAPASGPVATGAPVAAPKEDSKNLFIGNYILQRKKQRKKKRLMQIWEDFSEMTTEQIQTSRYGVLRNSHSSLSFSNKLKQYIYILLLFIMYNSLF